MKEILYYTMLFDLYGELLTSKQQDYFKDYYFNNLSLSEIAENYEITRNAIHNQLREAKEKLENVLEKLCNTASLILLKIKEPDNE